MSLADIARRLEGVRRTSAGILARFTAHDNNRAALPLGTGDGWRVLLNCHAGCTIQDAVAAQGITPPDLGGAP